MHNVEGFIDNLRRLGFLRLEELKLKPKQHPGWAASVWRPTPNGYKLDQLTPVARSMSRSNASPSDG